MCLPCGGADKVKAKTHSFYPCNQLTLIDHVIFGNGFPCGMQPISTFSPSITLNCVGVMRLTVGASKISRKKRDDLRYKVNMRISAVYHVDTISISIHDIQNHLILCY